MAERRLGLVEALDCAIQIAEALAAAHGAGIVHRDVKPANVMVSDAGQVKVLDFGLAKLMERDGSGHAEPTETGGDSQTEAVAPKTREGALLGTAAYMSPEQADERPVDARSDVFSLGSVLYEMLAGRRPFQGHSRISTLTAILRDAPLSLKSLRPDVPRDLEQIVLHSVGLPPGIMQSMGWEIPAEIDPFHFAPRVRAPVLMLNGRYDSTFPPDTHQKPLFQLLGTPEKDKRHVLFDCGHSLLRTHDAIRETLAWLDRYLGPVDIQAPTGPTP